MFQLGATPMSDNEPDDKYIYEIAVFTGIRRNAGTTSKVRTICHWLASSPVCFPFRVKFYPRGPFNKTTPSNMQFERFSKVPKYTILQSPQHSCLRMSLCWTIRIRLHQTSASMQFQCCNNQSKMDCNPILEWLYLFPLISIRTISQASSQRWLWVDANACCKWTLTHDLMRVSRCILFCREKTMRRTCESWTTRNVKFYSVEMLTSLPWQRQGSLANYLQWKISALHSWNFQGSSILDSIKYSSIFEMPFLSNVIFSSPAVNRITKERKCFWYFGIVLRRTIHVTNPSVYIWIRLKKNSTANINQICCVSTWQSGATKCQSRDGGEGLLLKRIENVGKSTLMGQINKFTVMDIRDSSVK